MVYNAFRTGEKKKKKYINRLLQFNMFNYHVSNFRILNAHLYLKAIVFPICRSFNDSFTFFYY